MEGRGCECVVWDASDTDACRSRRLQFRYTDREAVPGWIECAIVLGGDGTLIQAARDLAGSNIPLLGVNMGTLGYLAQIGREEDILPALDELIADHYGLEQRIMLKGTVISDGRVIAEDIALNDIVLSRMGLNMLRFNLSIDGEIFKRLFGGWNHCGHAHRLYGLQPVGRRPYRGAGFRDDPADAYLPAHPEFQKRGAGAGPGDRAGNYRPGGRRERFLSFDGDTQVNFKKWRPGAD